MVGVVSVRVALSAIPLDADLCDGITNRAMLRFQGWHVDLWRTCTSAILDMIQMMIHSLTGSFVVAPNRSWSSLPVCLASLE